MATVVRNTSPDVAVYAAAHNDLKAQIGAGAAFHLDACENTITAATATDLPTSIALLTQIRAIYVFHCADSLALKAVDGTNTVAAAAGSNVDLATSIVMANQIRAAYEAHRVSTVFNYSSDATNTMTAAAATDLPSLQTLVNDLKAKINAHMASAPASKSLRVVPA